MNSAWAGRVADALRYWEPRRVIYNAVLAAVVVGHVDLFVQFSGLRDAWAKWRVAVLIVGTAFAAVIAHFFCTNILA